MEINSLFKLFMNKSYFTKTEIIYDSTKKYNIIDGHLVCIHNYVSFNTIKIYSFCWK